ncbi:hypothetical protein K439DRAFT_1610346 [Ramaria rubella]|nr:hypothetical protein K439DRAFT_1610346 [Ramaria rubella]
MALHQTAVDTRINGPTSRSRASLADVTPRKTSAPNNAFIRDALPFNNDGERLYLVIVEPRLKNTTEFLFGVVMKSWPKSTPMASITQYALDRYNEVWTKVMDFLLQPCDIQLRWHGNRTILENSADKLLGEFYQQHWEDRDWSIFFTIPNKYKSYTKGSLVIALEVFINTVKPYLKFEIRTGSEAMVKLHSKATKKATNKRSAPEEPDRENKRVCGTLETEYSIAPSSDII